MNIPEGINYEDIRSLSEAVTYFRTKDYDNAVNSIRKISAKCEDSKGKLNKSTGDVSKFKGSKDDDFKNHLQMIGNKLKFNLENVDKFDSYNTTLLYNYALITHMLQQHIHCMKILDKLDKYRSLLDEFTQTQFIQLRLENYFNIQVPVLGLKIIEIEMSLDENKNLADFRKTNYEIFHLRFQLQLNDVVEASKNLEKLKKGDFSIPLHFIEANVLYFNQKLINSIQCLTSISLISDSIYDREIMFYWNNLGCIYFHLNKHNVGTMYFNRSLNFTDNKKNKSGTVSITQKEIHLNSHYKIIHNLGVQLLFANKPVDAFDLLLEVVNVYPKNPRLWLRLAECCIKAYKIDQTDVASKAKFVQSVVSSDKFKKVVIDNEIKECKQPWDEVAAMPTPTLEFGSLCIRNALFLLPNHPEFNDINFEMKNMNLIEWYKTQSIYVNPAGCIRGIDIIHLESSLLLNGAYISLCLNNHVEAYKFSEKLLHQPILSPNHKYLARMYMSEAMLMMNSYTNIMALLNPTTQIRLSNNPNVTFDSKELDQNNITIIPKFNNFPSTLEEAHSIMYYNLGVVHAILHQDKHVEQCLTEALKLNPKLKMSTHYAYLGIYHEIRQGKIKNCLNILGDLCSNIPIINNIEV